MASISFSAAGKELALSQEALWALVDGGGSVTLSEALTAELGAFPPGTDPARALTALPPGTWPLASGASRWIASSVVVGQSRLVFLEKAPAGRLNSFLDDWRGGESCLLCDAEGVILAASTHASEAFGAVPGMRLSQFLTHGSVAVFHGALSEVLAGEASAPLTMELMDASGGRTSAVVETRVLPVPGSIALVTLAAPSLDLAGFCPSETSFTDTVFGSLPIPAAIIGASGIINRMNDAATDLARRTTGRSILNTSFLDFVRESERESIAAIHRTRSEGGLAPFSYEVSLQSDTGVEITVEVTALKLPEGGDTLVFLMPLGGFDEGGGDHSGLVGDLLSIIRDTEGSDPHRLVLDLVMAGTGARGMSLRAGSSLVTAGEVPVGDEEQSPVQDAPGERWSKGSDGQYEIEIVTRLRSGPCSMKLFGIHSRTPSGLAGLMLGLAPLLAEYAESVESVRKVMKAFSSILEIWALLQEDAGGLEHFLERIADAASARQVFIWSGAGADGNLSLLAMAGPGREPEPMGVHSETPAAWAYTHSETVYVADTLRDSRFSPMIPESRSELAVPLMRKGRAQGVLAAISPSAGAFANPVPSLLKLHAVALSFWLYPDSPHLREERSAEASAGEDQRSWIEDVILSLTHRLRSPSATLQAASELVLSGRQEDLDPEVRETVVSMARAGALLSDQTERLLSLVRLEISRERQEASWGRPREVLEAMRSTIERKVSAAGLRFRMELPEEPFTARFDRSKLEEAVYNLVDNAVKFNRPDGEVVVRMKVENQAWFLEVEDTGRGIPSRALPYIFDRFYRSTTEQGSLGIGLTIVKRLVERLGGTVSVFSREGRGSRFILRFPVSG